MNQKMALNEEDKVENVKKFPVLYDKSNDEFHRKDIRKNAWTKVAEYRGIEDCRLCLNKAASGTCSRDIPRTTAISESEFFVTIVNRGVLRTFTNSVKFKFQILFNKQSYKQIMHM